MIAEVGPSRTLSHCKICNLEDFTHPDLYPVIRDVFGHETDRFGGRFPEGHEYRKYWEVAMAVRVFRDCGLLHGGAELLGVGAGNEPTIFYLTNYVRRVFATDLYLADEWEESANASMLTDPERHWPFAWNPRRLVVQHMDALDLRYEDDTFDGIFSSSSIEHFGGLHEVRASAHEMFRVLKPGGILSLSTEFRLQGPSPGVPGVLMFGIGELYRYVFGDDDWLPVSPFDFTMSPATLASEADFAEVAADHIAQTTAHGGHFTFKLEYAHYPHIVMRFGEHLFTSVHLALRKCSS